MQEGWAAAEVLQSCFGGMVVKHFGSLQRPGLVDANVFFRPTSDPLIAVSVDDDDGTTVLGVAQAIPCLLTDACGVPGAPGRSVAFLQNVAVLDEARRRGIGKALVHWTEDQTRWRDAGVEEMWLAIAEDNLVARGLYDAAGFEAQGVRFENVLMRKVIGSDAVDSQGRKGWQPRTSSGVSMRLRGDEEAEVEAAVAVAAAVAEATTAAEATAAVTQVESEAAVPREGVGNKPLLANLGVQLMYCAIASFGISLLLAPFGGPTVPSLLCLAPPWPSSSSSSLDSSLVASLEAFGRPLAAAATGVGCAIAELRRLGIDYGPGDEQLDYGPAQAEQMRPLWEIAGGERRVVIAAGVVVIWQLSIALAEELYYRGLMQSAGVLLLSALADALPAELGTGAAGIAAAGAREVLPLMLSSALFGLVHAEFVNEAPPGTAPSEFNGVAETKAAWFWSTATYGLAYGSLYVVSGHQVLAPAFCHAGINVGLCMRDWRRMRNTPEGALQRMFARSN